MKKKCDLLNSWWTICWNWLFSTYLWCVNIKQFVFTFQHHKFRHFIACRTSWMILATHSPPTLALPLLFLYSLPLLISRDVWLFYQRVAQGYRNEEGQAHACPGSAFACSDMEQRLGWALAWWPGLLGNCCLLLPSSCGFISTEPKYFSLMKTERLLLWEWCAVWVPPSVHRPPKVIWASGNLCFTGLLQGLALLVFSAWP